MGSGKKKTVIISDWSSAGPRHTSAAFFQVMYLQLEGKKWRPCEGQAHILKKGVHRKIPHTGNQDKNAKSDLLRLAIEFARG